jgi:hypothetical protein
MCVSAQECFGHAERDTHTQHALKHTHTHTHTHTTRTHARTHAHTYKHTLSLVTAQVHRRVLDTRKDSFTHTYKHTRIHIFTRTHTHKHTRIHIFTRTHTHTHTRIHIFTRARTHTAQVHRSVSDTRKDSWFLQAPPLCLHTQVYIHTYIHTHTHTFKPLPTRFYMCGREQILYRQYVYLLCITKKNVYKGLEHTEQRQN